MRSSIEDFVKTEDTDINGDKPTSGVSNQVNEQFSADLCKKAYERIVKEIVDKRERIANKSERRSKNPMRSSRNASLNTCSNNMSHLV